MLSKLNKLVKKKLNKEVNIIYISETNYPLKKLNL